MVLWIRDLLNRRAVMRKVSCILMIGALFAGRGIAADHASVTEPMAQPPGAALFENNCSQCHDHGVASAPIRNLLMQMTPNAVYNALTKGAMRPQASRLSDAERRQIVEYLTGGSPGEASTPLLMCRNDASWFDRTAVSVGTGWGIDASNTRSIPREQAGLAAKDLNKLTLRWTFAFPDSASSRSQPTIVGNALFVGSQSGTVYAMDARSGCVHWTFQATGEVRGAVIFRPELAESGARKTGNSTLFFGDVFAYVYAIDAATGSLLWKVKVDDHPVARIAATPVLSRKAIYVPLGSWGEEIAAASPDYVCCTFRGSIVALDRATGATIWKRYTIPIPAVEQYRNSLGNPHLGPSGAGVWSSPAYDEKRSSIYFTTGNNYSDPADDNSDAVFAIDAETGDLKWKRQTLANDAFNDGCGGGKRLATCPKKSGPDADFTAPPILVPGKNGRDILLAGQKSGDAFGLDPDTGKVLWHMRISEDPSPLSGGIWFGMVAQNNRLILPSISLRAADAPPPSSADEFFQPSPVNGLHALNAFTGKLIWSAPVTRYCEKKTPCAGVMMAPLAIPGALFAGSVDGYIRAFDEHSGNALWRFNTAQEFKSLNGDLATGGAIMGAGAVMVANGMVYVSTSGKSGGALLAFSFN